MPRIRIHWNLLSAGRIPKAIRLSLETRMTFLWRFLERFRVARALGSEAGCRSEGFQMSVDHWTFTYEIDLAEGVAVVQRAIDHGCGSLMS
jgi:hypothetical protein